MRMSDFLDLALCEAFEGEEEEIDRELSLVELMGVREYSARPVFEDPNGERA